MALTNIRLMVVYTGRAFIFRCRFRVSPVTVNVYRYRDNGEIMVSSTVLPNGEGAGLSPGKQVSGETGVSYHFPTIVRTSSMLQVWPDLATLEV